MNVTGLMNLNCNEVVLTFNCQIMLIINDCIQQTPSQSCNPNSDLNEIIFDAEIGFVSTSANIFSVGQ